ncbi:phosphonate metabolism transcriptional regulator PhnF [Denitrobaculum tricleocarpae]|nr:phosphonate metabolism transcriptional regulator PhnF [Denitrobaculum tricleocarpae]
MTSRFDGRDEAFADGAAKDRNGVDDMIERGTGIALWRQIEQQLAEDVAAGVYPEGSRLPTEPELAERFGVNRHTLRRAVAGLVEQGLLRVEQGRGTFVQEHVVDYLIGKRTRFSEIITKQHRNPAGRLLRAQEFEADQTVAKGLKLKPGTPCILLETLNDVDGRPLSVSSNYFPAGRFPELIPVYAETRSITKALTHHGAGDYTRRTTKVMARLPEAEDAKALKQPASKPVLVVESINVDQDGKPVQFCIARFVADRMQIVFET